MLNYFNKYIYMDYMNILFFFLLGKGRLTNAQLFKMTELTTTLSGLHL